MDYRYSTLPEACRCESCGYVLENPGTHCRQIPCPQCGGIMWRIKGNPGVAVGAYTDIINIIAPSQAWAGDPVSIEVQVRNLHAAAIYIAVSGRYNGVDIAFSPEYATVDAGGTYSFTSSFTMPNNDVRVHIWSFYWTGAEWYQDDYDYIDIALLVEYKGTLSRKELKYDTTTGSIPVR